MTTTKNTELRKIGYVECIELIRYHSLFTADWLMFAAWCIKEGVDYRSRTLTNCMKELTGNDYILDIALQSGDDWTDLYKEIESHLGHDPNAEWIYQTCAIHLHGTPDSDIADVYALVLCTEYGVLYNDKKFNEIYNNPYYGNN